MDILIALVALTLGYYVGFNSREVRNKLERLMRKVEEKREVGPTAGSYYRPNENAPLNNSSKVGAVLPKSPNLIEWEEQERIRKMQTEVRTKPR